eukprot:scaffold3038_cov163-Amphora_coffeaeformis.AAC.7
MMIDASASVRLQTGGSKKCAGYIARDDNSSSVSFVSSKPSSVKAKSRIIFLGTGSSTGCPKPLCTMLFSPKGRETFSGTDQVFEEMRERFRDNCHVSNKAIIGNPLHNKNYRNNPSLLIAQYDEKDDRMKHIIIDVGKTFRESSLRFFPEYDINSLDAVILTHEHADASFGLDDLRGYQRVYPVNKPNEMPRTIPMKVYLSQPCLDKLSIQFPWLFPRQEKPDPSKPVVQRFVSTLEVNVFDSFQTLNVEGLSVVTLPVMHGEDLVSYGFAFTVGQTNIVYLSDISRMLPETMDFILHRLPPTDILIVDSLYPDRSHPVHYCMNEAVEIMKQIKPKQTYFVGMNCDAFLPHEEANKKLRRQYGNAQLAHDGLAIEC